MTGKRLSGLDASFLHLEGADAHMHVASVLTFEGPPPSYEALCDHVRSRLHLVPRFRQKLRFVPFDQGRPIWVDDPHFNLTYHVRHSALPEPGSDEQLRNLAARAFSQSLDRSKPLWEMWLVSGLNGDRFALIGKSHHCLVDGVAGIDLVTVLFDAQREPEAPPAPPADDWIPRPEPTQSRILAEALLERATSPVELVRGVRALVRGPRRVASRLAEGVAAAGSFAGVGLAAPPSPLNLKIGPHRRIALVSADLDDFKQIKNALGGTVNDVILTVVTGALGRYLRARGHSTRELELRAMVPVSTRTELERGELGNRISAIMAPLPIWCEDPVERLELIRERMGNLKESRQAVGATMLTQLADFAPPTILGQASRLQSRQRFFNLVVTNIPGPQFPLYVLGREMQHVFPLVPLARNQAVCVGIMSYNGQVNFGLVGDYDAMSDIEDLAADVEAAIAQLLEASILPEWRETGKSSGSRFHRSIPQSETSKATPS